MHPCISVKKGRVEEGGKYSLNNSEIIRKGGSLQKPPKSPK